MFSEIFSLAKWQTADETKIENIIEFVLQNEFKLTFFDFFVQHWIRSKHHSKISFVFLTKILERMSLYQMQSKRVRSQQKIKTELFFMK